VVTSWGEKNLSPKSSSLIGTFVFYLQDKFCEFDFYPVEYLANNLQISALKRVHFAPTKQQNGIIHWELLNRE